MEETTDKTDQKPKTKRRAPRTGKRGRPKGSTNRQFIEVLEIPAACPYCGSTELKDIPGRPRQTQDNTGLVNGSQFNQVEWRWTQCPCGQFLRVRRYLKKQ